MKRALLCITALVLASRLGHAQQNNQRPARNGYGRPPASRAATPVAPHMDLMPSVEEVYSRVSGADPVDTLARQLGAFRQLAGIVRSLSAGGDFGNSMTIEEQQLSARYIGAAQEVDRKGTIVARSAATAGGAASAPPWFSARMTYDSEAYRDELLNLFSPRLKDIYQSRFGTFAAKTAPMRERANAQIRADQDQKAKQAAEQKKAEADTERLKAATESAREAYEARKVSEANNRRAALADGASCEKHKIDTNICGVPLGTPLNLPDCTAVSHVEDALLGKKVVTDKTCLSIGEDGSSEVRFGKDVCPKWITTTNNALGEFGTDFGMSSMSTEMTADVLSSVTFTFVSGLENGVSTSEVESAQKQLRAKYGRPTRVGHGKITNGYGAVTRKTEEPEWSLPAGGPPCLHVTYTADARIDTVTIELHSKMKERAKSKAKSEEAETKL
jgi:hypothetical protein